MSRTRTRPRSRPRASRPHLVPAALALAVLMWLALELAFRAAYSGRVLPNVSVEGIPLGGTDADETRKRLTTVRANDRRITATAADRRFTVHAEAVGFRVDIAATAARARTAGRAGPTAGLFTTLPVVLRGAEQSAVFEVDRQALQRVVARVAERVDRRPFPGDLIIDPRTTAVRAVAPRAGLRLVRAAAATNIVRALSDDRGTAELPTRSLPAPSRAAVERVAEEARTYLSRPLRLRSPAGPATIGRSELARLLTVAPARGAQAERVELAARRERLETVADELAAARSRAPRDARIGVPADAPLIDAKDDLAWRPRRAAVSVTPSRTGYRLDREHALDAIAAAVRRGRHDAVLPVQITRPGISTASASRVRRLIGTFTTHYACCEPRVTNIRRVARAVDGTVIAPGAQFSLNGAAGERTRAKGYVEAPFIADGRLVPSVGGGVSQFATTMYNAAFFAGLRLDAHQPHSFYIDRYPAGREATVDYGTIDLTWTNDTEAPVVVRTASTATSVTVALYGDNGGRRVRAESGRRDPVPGRDFAVRVTRVIRYADGRVARETYVTTYDRPPAPE